MTAAGIDTPVGFGEESDPSGPRLEPSIARLLTAGTYAAIALLAIGFALMLRSGTDPLSPAPPFDITAIPAGLLALRPEAYLNLGLIVVIATPSARVLASLIGFARRGEHRMVLVASAILLVIALSVVVAKGLEG
jgi:uncharacterized membrane protein